jgi:hypothetical protein
MVLHGTTDFVRCVHDTSPQKRTNDYGNINSIVHKFNPVPFSRHSVVLFAFCPALLHP